MINNRIDGKIILYFLVKDFTCTVEAIYWCPPTFDRNQQRKVSWLEHILKLRNNKHIRAENKHRAANKLAHCTAFIHPKITNLLFIRRKAINFLWTDIYFVLYFLLWNEHDNNTVFILVRAFWIFVRSILNVSIPPTEAYWHAISAWKRTRANFHCLAWECSTPSSSSCLRIVIIRHYCLLTCVTNVEDFSHQLFSVRIFL